ncbi:MAG TPA: UDP-N-acetylglucosamine 2-epimerase (non-hydrolyzing) [Candidatus Dormibacteraeota bacterium]|nr:UDP-N-acetylglucosamine 2-epimerase (non-hydrolyzing) [Candidatus Dormibacteraeota bacterium]
MKVLTVVGARPQFIKAGAVSAVLRRDHVEFLLHTGQHYDAMMSDVFFDELGMPAPDCNLGIGSGMHGQQTGRMLAAVEQVIVEQRPDWVLVYGDTNSTLAGALAAVKLHVPVAHVEAGLRSFDRRMPEEINRVVTDHVSSLCLCPTEAAAAQLAREGVTGAAVTGDVMLDAFLQQAGRVPSRGGVLHRLGLEPGGFVLATLHRAENVDDAGRLRAILEGLARSGCEVVLPLHPRTRQAISRFGLVAGPAVHLVEPVGYLDMIALEMHAAAVVTDSGGVQKEAYFAGRPCVTVRDTTEWTETVEAGWNRLVGCRPEAIAAAVAGFRPAGERPPLFGDGRAAERVVAALAAERRP